MEAQAALNKAKIALMSRADTVFFTYVCFSLKHKWDACIPTACTNGKEIRFNPTFFMKLAVEEQLFLILHETLHVALMHMLRLKDRDKQRWNIAADYVINLMLVERGFKMPKGGLLDTKYVGMSTEQVYAQLLEEDDEGLPDCDEDLQEPGEGEDGDQEGNRPALEEEIKEILVRASIQSKLSGDKIGTIPGELQIYLDKLLKPKLPWQSILRKYLKAMTKSDYSFRKPNRRFMPDHYLPSLYSEKLMDLAVAIDTSGSVSDKDFQRLVSEVASIFKMMKPKKITLVQFDTELKEVSRLKSLNDLLQVKFQGRGGTDIDPVIAWAEQNKPQLLLVFTDGYFSDPAETHKPNTLWLIHNNPGFQAPFGKAIHYEIEQ